jgi:hypothetical protein
MLSCSAGGGRSEEARPPGREDRAEVHAKLDGPGAGLLAPVELRLRSIRSMAMFAAKSAPGSALRRAAFLLAIVAALLAVPAAAAAHVNRQVGPYTILVILVEEPTFEDNRAGFEFWVRRDDQPITGLDRTVRAEATGHGVTEAMAVPPLEGDFYVLDHTTAGESFDPLGGGPWTLHLSGTINDTPLDEDFAVTFPSYPRIGPAKPTAAPAAAPTNAFAGAALPVAGLLLAGLLSIAVFVLRRYQTAPRAAHARALTVNGPSGSAARHRSRSSARRSGDSPAT